MCRSLPSLCYQTIYNNNNPYVTEFQIFHPKCFGSLSVDGVLVGYDYTLCKHTNRASPIVSGHSPAFDFSCFFFIYLYFHLWILFDDSVIFFPGVPVSMSIGTHRIPLGGEERPVLGDPGWTCPAGSKLDGRTTHSPSCTALIDTGLFLSQKVQASQVCTTWSLTRP